MSDLIRLLLSGLFAAFLAAGAQAEAVAPGPGNSPEASTAADIPDSEELERELQSLSWEQFKSVVTAVPKLKADVDAYGPLGWQYVQANYKTYRWRKSINKLHDDQKKHLASLIVSAKENPKVSN